MELAKNRTIEFKNNRLYYVVKLKNRNTYCQLKMYTKLNIQAHPGSSL